ncbi:MAG: pilus assembly protein [Planctomycetes bacterium]|nr:pilus assembly protein [Planctomycetota bacterium]
MSAAQSKIAAQPTNAAQPKSAARRLHEDEGGQAMVEFVLVFPIQLLLTLCVIQFAFIAHAHLVVEQAAFLGARAGAVADVGQGGFTDEGAWRAAGTKAARRVAARTCAVLTSSMGVSDAPLLDQDDRAAMRWSSAEGGSVGFSDVRVQEAFKHLDVKFTPRPQQGYVACEVTYDYTMMIPVANHLFARTQIVFQLNLGGQGNAYGAPSQERQRTVYRVRQASFIPTPWTRAPR